MRMNNDCISVVKSDTYKEKLRKMAIDIKNASRSRVKIPKYDAASELHKSISELSKIAHDKYQSEADISIIKKRIDILYMQML